MRYRAVKRPGVAVRDHAPGEIGGEPDVEHAAAAGEEVYPAGAARHTSAFPYQSPRKACRTLSRNFTDAGPRV